MTNTEGKQIYAFDQVGGSPVNTYDLPVSVRGIAVDHFRSQYTSGPMTPSFVYSVDGSGGAEFAEFYRQYFNATTAEYITSCPGR